MELLKTFEYGTIKVETFYNGTSKVPNKTYINNELVYEDSTFRPSPLMAINSKDVMVALLSFLVLTKEDVEDEFFEIRNCPIVDSWADSDEAQEISMMIYDFEMKDDADFILDNELTKIEASRITKYIK